MGVTSRRATAPAGVGCVYLGGPFVGTIVTLEIIVPVASNSGVFGRETRVRPACRRRA